MNQHAHDLNLDQSYKLVLNTPYHRKGFPIQSSISQKSVSNVIIILVLLVLIP